MKFRVATTVYEKQDSSMTTITVINYRFYRNESLFGGKEQEKHTLWNKFMRTTVLVKGLRGTS